MVIVLATDGSENATFAAKFLARYPAPKDAKVYCCSVYSPMAAVTAAAHPFLGGILGDRMAAAIEAANETAHAAAADAAADLSAAGFDTEASVMEGDPATKISEFSESHGADLTVFGAIGVSAVEEIMMGSVARALVHHAKSSILVVKQRPFSLASGLRAIYATDLSEASAKTRARVPSLAPGKFEELDIVTVATDLKMIQAAEATQIQLEKPPPESPEITRQRVIEWYQERLKQVQSDLATAADSFTTTVLEGDPRKALVEHAKSTNADLLVTGARSHSMLSRLFIGSVSEHLVNRASCSVMVVRP